MRRNRPIGQAALPLAAALWLSWGAAGADERLPETGRGCIAEGNGGRVVPAFCRAGPTEPAGNVRAVLANAPKGSAERVLYEGCLAEWRTLAGGYEWRMVEFCLQSTVRASDP
jgi:hypothetical protein